MYAIQNGPNWWIDSTARFPVGQIQSRGRIGAMNDTITRNPLDTDETGSSFKLLISELSESDGDNQNPATDTYKRSLSDLQLQNPESSIESTSPSLDRMGLFALLKA